MKITSHVTLITTGVHIDLCGAPKVEDNHQHAGERFVPTLACWSATLHSTGVQLRESLESDLVRFCGDAYSRAPIPYWVPRPPDGWDAAVVAFRQACAEGQEASA